MNSSSASNLPPLNSSKERRLVALRDVHDRFASSSAQAERAPALPRCLRRKPVLQDFLTAQFYSPAKPDVVFDEDGEVLLVVGKDGDQRRFLLRASFLREHSSLLEGVLERLEAEGHSSKNPVKVLCASSDVLSLFVLLRGLHSNVWPKQASLKFLVRVVRTLSSFRLLKEQQDGSAAHRSAARRWLRALHANLGGKDVVKRWTLLKAACFLVDVKSFRRLAFELVLAYAGDFRKLEVAQKHKAILGEVVAFPRVSSPDGLEFFITILAELTLLRDTARTHLNNVYFQDIFKTLFDDGPFPSDNLLDLPPPPKLINKVGMAGPSSSLSSSPSSSSSSDEDDEFLPGLSAIKYLFASPASPASEQCTCGWLPSYYNSWLELVDARLPFPFDEGDDEKHSLNDAVLRFRAWLGENNGEGAVEVPWKECPEDMEPECEMSKEEHVAAGAKLRKRLGRRLDNWDRWFRRRVEELREEVWEDMDGGWWVPWEQPEEEETEVVGAEGDEDEEVGDVAFLEDSGVDFELDGWE